ncbi:hypothetical protein Tco_0144958, partial [Tanacetum coccineum]
AARSDVMRNADYDSYDEEEYQIKRNKFRAPIYGSKPTPYLNCCYTKEEESTGQWRTEIRLTDPYGNIYLQGFTTKKTDWKLSKYYKLSDIMSPNLWEHTMIRPDHQDPNALDKMKPWKRYYYHKFTMSSCYGKDVAEMQSLEIDDMLRIRMRETGSNEEIFTSVAWIRAFNINEPINAELCHEFYSTYEFDKVYADDELQTKNIIKFRLGRCAQSLTLLEFARRLGLYQAIELDEEGFNVYFKGGLRSDEHFNTHEYWLSISREENLGLSRSHTSTIKNPILRVIHKMITYGLCQRTTGMTRWMKRKEAGTQKESQICYGQSISKIARSAVLTKDVDLYVRMRRMEIRQEAIEMMEYRQSYHWDRYQEVFKHIAGVYSVLLSGAYNPHGYAQPHFLELRSEQLQISHSSLRLCMRSFVAFSRALVDCGESLQVIVRSLVDLVVYGFPPPIREFVDICADNSEFRFEDWSGRRVPKRESKDHEAFPELKDTNDGKSRTLLEVPNLFECLFSSQPIVHASGIYQKFSYLVKYLGYEGFGSAIEATSASAITFAGSSTIHLRLNILFHFTLHLRQERLLCYGVKSKRTDLLSFKIFDKSSSFTFHEMSSAPDSSFALEVVGNPLRAVIPKINISWKSIEASCPDADS